MAVFKYYNVQLLPIDTQKIGEVGAEGYKKVFQELKSRVTGAKRRKALESIAGRLRNDFYFSPYTVKVRDDFAYGDFLKHDQVDKVENLYTGKDEFEGGVGSISKKHDFLFVFDYSSHTLAIQLAKGLPSAGPLIDALVEILRPIADSLHPNHQLHIQELTSAQSLSKVFGAERFKRVSVEVTFSNSEELEEELLRGAGVTESDLKQKSVHSVTHIEKPAKNSSMSGLSNIAKPLLVIAAQYGNADVHHSTEDGGWDHYHMRDYPVKEEVVKEKGEAHTNFVARVFNSIRLAWSKTAVADDVERQLQQTGAQRADDDMNDRNDGGELV